jgi:ribosome-binding protein aMBF1 (putative translation factor)
MQMPGSESQRERDVMHGALAVVETYTIVVDQLRAELGRQRQLLAPRLAAMDAMGRIFDGMFRR